LFGVISDIYSPGSHQTAHVVSNTFAGADV